MTEQELVARELDEEFREADAKLDALRAKAEAARAEEQTDEISRLWPVRERVEEKLSELKRGAASNLDATRRKAENALRELEVRIDHAVERFAAWDASRERRFNARLDEAEVRLWDWKERAEAKEAGLRAQVNDTLAKLEETIALGRARIAEWRQARHSRKAEEALRDAARHLDEAYDAAARRIEE